MWRPGKCRSIVTDVYQPGVYGDGPDDHGLTTNEEFYGGKYLVCETVGTELEPVLCVAQEALGVCMLLLQSEAISGLPKLWEAVQAAVAVKARYEELRRGTDPVAAARIDVEGLPPMSAPLDPQPDRTGPG